MKRSEFKKTFCMRCPIILDCKKFDHCHAYNLCDDDDLVTPVNAIINALIDLDKVVRNVPFSVMDASVYGKMAVRLEWPETVEEIAKVYGVDVETNRLEIMCEIANVTFYSERS